MMEAARFLFKSPPCTQNFITLSLARSVRPSTCSHASRLLAYATHRSTTPRLLALDAKLTVRLTPWSSATA